MPSWDWILRSPRLLACGNPPPGFRSDPYRTWYGIVSQARTKDPYLRDDTILALFCRSQRCGPMPAGVWVLRMILTAWGLFWNCASSVSQIRAAENYWNTCATLLWLFRLARRSLRRIISLVCDRKTTFEQFQFAFSILLWNVIWGPATPHTRPFLRFWIPSDFRVFHCFAHLF